MTRSRLGRHGKVHHELQVWPTEGIVVIRSPKTARFAGRVQHVAFRDPLVILLSQRAWLSWPLCRSLVEKDLTVLERWLSRKLGGR